MCLPLLGGALRSSRKRSALLQAATSAALADAVRRSADRLSSGAERPAGDCGSAASDADADANAEAEADAIGFSAKVTPRGLEGPKPPSGAIALPRCPDSVERGAELRGDPSGPRTGDPSGEPGAVGVSGRGESVPESWGEAEDASPEAATTDRTPRAARRGAADGAPAAPGPRSGEDGHEAPAGMEPDLASAAPPDAGRPKPDPVEAETRGEAGDGTVAEAAREGGESERTEEGEGGEAGVARPPPALPGSRSRAALAAWKLECRGAVRFVRACCCRCA